LKYTPKLNKHQRHAVAKALAAPDLFLLQGPPGTGKTRVLAQICHETISRGKRMLVASQANIAVDNILSYLARQPEILPLRIGSGCDKNETQSPFSNDLVIYRWLSTVREACIALLSEGKDLAAAHEKINRQWHHFAEMVQEHEKLKKRQIAIRKGLQKGDGKSADLAKALGEFESHVSTYSATISTLEYIMGKLNGHLPFTDLGEWVRIIPAADRAEIFKPLASWCSSCSFPEIVKKLLSSNQPHNGNEPTGHAKCSWARILPRWFRRHFLQKEETKIQPSEANVEPNWAVEWIESISIFNRLRSLQENLPGLLELCQEGERLCAAAVVSQVPERTWVKFTATLHSILEVLGNGVVINVLGLNDIPTSLRPKKRFQKQFARAGCFCRKCRQQYLKHSKACQRLS